jgi:murein L,D-transpeptidase YafK
MLLTSYVDAGSIYLRVFKQESILEVWKKSNSKYYLDETINICALSGLLGPKEAEGDYQVPEGFYKIKSINPYSKYKRSFELNYPNAYDKKRNRTGSFIMIHGGCASIGCIAIEDYNIERLYKLIKRKRAVKVDIYPFRMTELNLYSYQDGIWDSFWYKLKKRYDYFEKYHSIPRVNKYTYTF